MQSFEVHLQEKNMADLTNKQKKDWAKLLYLKSNLNQKEIAATVDVTEKTLSSWVNNEKDNWERLKSSYVITREQELRRIYNQISELNTYIEQRDPGQRFASSKESDTLAKLAVSAKSLEADTSISEIISVFSEFIEFVREIDNDMSKKIIDYQDAFIKHKLSGK